MYGKVKKCAEQIKADQEFLIRCDKIYKTRKAAASHMVMQGWKYFHSGKPDTSMMRFNQAYLLDSLNAEIYWGFGNLLGMQKKFNESVSLFERSIKLNPNDANVWSDMSISYGNIFFETKNIKYLDTAITNLKKAVHLDSKNPKFYGQLTAAYCYFMQKDSANKYLRITDKLDKSAVNPEIRKILSETK